MMYDIFFSYPSADEDEVMPICSALRAAGLDVWIDKTEVKDGASITRSIVEGLAQSKVLLRTTPRITRALVPASGS